MIRGRGGGGSLCKHIITLRYYRTEREKKTNNATTKTTNVSAARARSRTYSRARSNLAQRGRRDAIRRAGPVPHHRGTQCLVVVSVHEPGA